MKPLLVVLLLMYPATAAQPRVRNLSMQLPENRTLTYGLSLPPDVTMGEPRPLVIALHPGGPRGAYYGSRFIGQLVSPAFADWNAMIAAPDCPTQSWAEPGAVQAVLALVTKLRAEHAIDGKKILLTGFSMGGRGTWFMSSRHPEVFTGAILMAAPNGDEPMELRAKIPTYVIHSRDDVVVPFPPAERLAQELRSLGRNLQFAAISGPGHSDLNGYVVPLRQASEWMAEMWRK